MFFVNKQVRLLYNLPDVHRIVKWMESWPYFRITVAVNDIKGSFYNIA